MTQPIVSKGQLAVLRCLPPMHHPMWRFGSKAVVAALVAGRRLHCNLREAREAGSCDRHNLHKTSSLEPRTTQSLPIRGGERGGLWQPSQALGPILQSWTLSALWLPYGHLPSPAWP